MGGGGGGWGVGTRWALVNYSTGSTLIGGLVVNNTIKWLVWYRV